MPADYTVHVDWDANGNFTGVYDDVTARTLDARTQVTVSYGRDTNRSLSPVKVGEAAFELNNEDRLFSPENTSSVLYDKAVPARNVRIQAVLAGTTYTPFRGHIDDLEFKPAIENESVDITCLDPMARLKGVDVTTVMYEGIRTGDAIHLILDAVGWDPALRDIDPGATLIRHWWLDNEDAFEAAMDLLDSEGPAALLTVDESGRIVFRDRHHRLLRSASQTVQSTWRASGAEPCFSAPTNYSHGWKEIINSVSFEVPVRAPTPERDIVWTAPGDITVPSGETVLITAKGNDPFVLAETPVVLRDYTITGSATITMSKTEGQSTTLFITSPSGTAVISDLRIRGYPLRTVATIVVTVEDGSSITRYGRRTGSSLRPPKWAGVHDAKAIGDLIVGKRGERLAAISVTFSGSIDARLVQQLSRDLSDRVHLIEPHTGLDTDCYIEQISHTIGQGGLEHKTVFGLEKARTVVTDPITFGVAGQGFGDANFAEASSDNPATMFLFDVAGRGFADGRFST